MGSDDETDICGAETTKGTPCQNAADACPWHDTDDAPDTGRDPKLTRERQEQIAADIEQGSSITAACRRAGIHKATFYNWMDSGEDQEEGIYADFFDRITRARGEGEEHYRRMAFEIAAEEGDTATIMAMLKQRYPDEWGDVDRGEQADGKIEVDSEVVTVTADDV